MTISRANAHLLYAFGAAVAFLAVVTPPLETLADRFFAWHMVQHLVMLFVVPLLVLASHPLEWFGPPRGRLRIAAIRLLRTAPVRAICSPASALAAFLAVLFGIHFTGLYEAALEHPAIHIAEHALLLATGTLFWLPVIAPPPLPVPPYPVRALYLFLALPQGALLAIALLAARTPLYAHYAGAGALSDQHNAAAVMWVGGGGIVLAALLLVIVRWAARERYAALALAAIAGGALLYAHPVQAASKVTPSYTGDQARAGQTLFYERCAECHGAMLEGHYGPPLKGRDGNLQWDSVQYVFQYMTGHMPVGDADGLTSQQYVDIMAFILSSHHRAPGRAPLTAAAANASTALLGL